MVDSIKITALQDIGANIAYTTLVPVVNMAGTPTSQKSNLQNLGNLILNGAGGSYFPRAAQATLALSVANAAQPNITSVGTLTSLAVTGNITAGNINGGNIVVANYFYGDGGFLTNVASGSNYSNSNVAAYLPTYTGNISGDYLTLTHDVTANVVDANFLYGDASNVTNLPVGNIAVINLDGNVANVLHGDGSWSADQTTYSNSNVANYLPTYTGTIGANTISSDGNSGGNLTINANGASFVFGQGGALYWPAPGGANWAIEPNIDDEFEIRSTSNVVISTDISNSNSHFTFDSEGIFTAPSNVNLLGSRLNVGPDAASAGNLLNPTLVIANTGAQYIQAAIINNDGAGSSDWSADGAGGSDDEAWTDMGFAGFSFNDANFSITEPGDGYLFVQAYANGLGGNMVLATGDHSNTADIVFATGGFMANNEFARIDHANDVFHLTRANSGIRFADGTTQSTAYTGGVGSELVNGDKSFALQSDGNVVFSEPEGGVNRGLVWDYGAVANGVNSTIRQDINGLSVRAWTENAGNYAAPVNIVTNQDANAKTWAFDGQGNLTVPSGSINSISDAGDLRAYVTLTPDLGLARLAGRSSEYTENFNSGGWTSASYTGTQVDITDAPNLLGFVSNNTTFTSAVDRTFSINGGEPVPYTGYGASGNNVTLYTDITADPDPTVVTSIDFYYQSESFVAIDYDDGTLNINTTGLTINLDNDQTSGPDINLRSGDDILLQAKNKALGSESEGGDINIYAGDGASDDGQGNTASTGGDIQIEAGNGGDGNSSSGSSGGFTTIRGGAGGSAGVTNAAGPGGYVNIEGGHGGNDGGNTSLGGVGGNVSITAGLTTQEGVNGSNVVISSGQAGPNALSGNVEIFTPASANGFGGTWRFDGNGKLTFPGTPRIDTYTNNFEVQAAESINFEANAVVNIYTDTGNAAYQWQFGDDGNLTLPGNTFAVNYANGTPVSIGGGGNTGNVTFDNVTVQGVNGLNLSAGSDFTANLAYLQVRAGDVASHIHLDTGNNSAYDLIVGDDQNYVQVSSTGNILLSSYDSNTSQYTWTLDYNGNLILAGGNSVIQSIANSSLDPLNPNVSTMALTPDANYSSQALVLDPTAPGHIHLRSPGANIDEPYANLFLGGENTSFEVGAFYGATPNAYVHSGGNTWTFASDGNLIFPRDANINTDPYLQIQGGATPTIISTDSSLAGPANLAISADYLNYSGFNGNKIVLHADTGEIATDANMVLTTNGANVGNTYSWTFSDDGLLTLPGGNVTIGSVLGGEAILASNTPFGVVSQGNGSTVLQWIDDIANATALSAIYINSPSGNTGDVAVLTGEPGANANIWTFGADGILTVPGDLVAVNASPAPVISGFSSVSALQFTNGNSNVTINANSNLWTFDSTGNLIIPGTSGGVIKTVANGAIAIAAIDNGSDNPAQVISFNANGTPTTAISSYANQATIQANINGDIKTWAFNNAGNLTLPGNTLAINYANGTAAFGNIVSVNKDGNSSNVLYGNGVFAAAPGGSSYGDSNVTTLLGSFGSNTISTTGNISGGNVTASGTSSNLIRRAFGLVASDVGVTLDDLTVTVSSATSQLTLSTSGSWQGTGWTETFAGGATPTVNSWVNLPLNPGFNNASGAMTSQGNGCRCVISDQTPSAKVYQITVVRSGTSGAQWNISIERLV